MDPPERGVGVIRVVLADDQALVRAGFAALIDAEEDMEVVGEASDGDEALRLADRERPDVVLMDIRMPGVDGIEATRRIAATPQLAGVHVVIVGRSSRRSSARLPTQWSRYTGNSATARGRGVVRHPAAPLGRGRRLSGTEQPVLLSAGRLWPRGRGWSAQAADGSHKWVNLPGTRP